VVIDHHLARVYQDVDGSRPRAEDAVRPYDPRGFHRHLTHRKEAHYQGERVPEEPSFYEEVAKELVPSQQIVLIGHGTGKSSALEFLVEYLKKHYATVYKRVIASEVAALSELTEPEIEAIAKRRVKTPRNASISRSFSLLNDSYLASLIGQTTPVRIMRERMSAIWLWTSPHNLRHEGVAASRLDPFILLEFPFAIQTAFSAAMNFKRASAVIVEDAGFCPVIRRPSVIEKGCQFSFFSKIAPSRNNSSYTRNGTTFVSFITSSSPFVKPVTRLPFTSGSSLYLTWRSTPGEWQTSEIGFPEL
jgi:hypothetical protein